MCRLSISLAKPLESKNLKSFLQRFDNFRDGELRHVEIESPTKISITISAQDSARAFDWITVTLEFSGVREAKLVDINKLSFIDMSEGISILYDNNSFAFGISKCENTSGIKTSICHIISADLKYKEGLF